MAYVPDVARQPAEVLPFNERNFLCGRIFLLTFRNGFGRMKAVELDVLNDYDGRNRRIGSK